MLFSTPPTPYTPNEVVEIEIAKKEKTLVFHDLACAGCGWVVRASGRGAVPGAILGPEGAALVESLELHCRATAGGGEEGSSCAASSATRRGSGSAAPPRRP